MSLKKFFVFFNKKPVAIVTLSTVSFLVLGSIVQAALTLSTSNVASDGALSFTAGGANQNITLTPSGTGLAIVSGGLIINPIGQLLTFNPPSAPGVPTITNGSAGSIAAGSYTYKVTWTGINAEETELGTVSTAWIADGSHQATITQPANPPASATGWKVYRSKVGPTSSWWALSGTIPITTATYNDNVADSSLTINNTVKSSTLGRRIYESTTSSIPMGLLGGPNASEGSIAWGYNALSSLTSGSSNVAIGSYSSWSDTTGADNASLGANSMYSNTTGSWNVAVGQNSLYFNVDGTLNTAIGYAALKNSVSASSNVAIGAAALNLNISGSNDTAIGYTAGHTSGNPASSANAVTSASGLTFVGYRAGLGSATQRSNATAIGNGAYVDADNTVVLGDQNVTQILAGSASQATLNATGLIIGTSTTPSTSTSTCVMGTIAWDTNYLYICIGTNSWKRATTTTW